MEIKQLTNDYKGYSWTTTYQTNGYYDLTKERCDSGFSFNWQKKESPHMINKSFASELFADYLEEPEAFGIFIDRQLVAIIETAVESWNQRLRVTSIWVDEGCRRQGLGDKLMKIAIKRAQENKFRGLVLETQSCNLTAIEFYLKMGFELIGFDLYAYSNEDIANEEVRFELMRFI